MVDELHIGMTLPGFCFGFFGRDSYWDKTVLGFGDEWIVAREESGRIVFAVFGYEGSHFKTAADAVRQWQIDWRRE